MLPIRGIRPTLGSTRRAGGATFLAVVTLVLALAACGGGAANDPPAPATPTATPAPPLPPLVVEYCVDDTGSYDPQYFTATDTLLAQAVVDRAVPNQQGATIYVTEINANTFAPQSTVDTITIPAVPAAATPGAAATTTANANPFDSATATAQAQQTAQAAQAAYSASQNAEQQALAAAQQAAQAGATFLKGLVQQPANATDIYGCLEVASQNFQHAPAGARTLLIIASDLQDNQNMTSYPRTMPGAHVLVIDYLCPQAQGCAATENTWRTEFTNDKAAGVTFYTPAETQAILNGQNLFAS